MELSINNLPNSEGQITYIRVPSCDVDVGYLHDAIQNVWGLPPELQSLIWAGRQLPPRDPNTLASYGIQDGSVLHLTTTLKGGKPAIYLLTSGAIPNVSVSVELSSRWNFCVLYPLVDIVDPATGQNQSKITWNVSVDKDGYVVDEDGIQHTYLFWEATSRRSAGDVVDSSAFDPANPILTAESSVVLCFENTIKYLQLVLQRFNLTPPMRHEFMVYWMPCFLKIRDANLDIAISFVSQEAYDKAAKLTVSPEPSTIGRVFMLFGGVSTTKKGLQQWQSWQGKTLSLAQAFQRVDWVQKIGLDLEGLQDESKFRVLEWGGMEIPSQLLMSAV